MSTPRLGCKYVFEPVLMDRGLLPRGAVVTVVSCPGMPRAKMPAKFRFVEHNGTTRMVLSASLVPYRLYKDAGRLNAQKRTDPESVLARVTKYLAGEVARLQLEGERFSEHAPDCRLCASRKRRIFDYTDAAVIVMARRADMALARQRGKEARCTCENNGDLCSHCQETRG